MPEVRYRVIGRGEPRPWIRLWLKLGDQEIPVPGIVDSGADRSSVPLRLAPSLGFAYEASDPKTGGGVGGPYTYFEATNKVAVRSEVGVFFLDRPNLNPVLPFLLLGRSDFFAAFRITFDQRQMKMLIDTYGAPATTN